MNTWTNTNLIRNQRKQIDLDFLAFLGLELGTSIVKLNQLRDYWDTGTFLGHKDFSSVMGRDIYLGTRACLWIHPYTRYSDDSNKDPLCHSRLLLDHFNQSSVEISTLCGVSSFHEITIRCKSRCLKKSYIKNKPNP